MEIEVMCTEDVDRGDMYDEEMNREVYTQDMGRGISTHRIWTERS